MDEPSLIYNTKEDNSNVNTTVVFGAHWSHATSITHSPHSYEHTHLLMNIKQMIRKAPANSIRGISSISTRNTSSVPPFAANDTLTSVISPSTTTQTIRTTFT